MPLQLCSAWSASGEVLLELKRERRINDRAPVFFVHMSDVADVMAICHNSNNRLRRGWDGVTFESSRDISKLCPGGFGESIKARKCDVLPAPDAFKNVVGSKD